MNYLLFYAVGVIILIGLFILVAFNFLRYRYQGDKTILIIALFIVLFLATIIETVIIVAPFLNPVTT